MTNEIPQEIRLFLEGILTEADVLIFDDDEKETILINMYSQLDSHLIGKVLEHLPEDKIEGFIDLDDEKENSTEKVQKYLEKHLPNAKEVFAQAFVEFKNMYLENVAIEMARYDALGGNRDTDDKNNALERISSGKHKALHVSSA